MEPEVPKQSYKLLRKFVPRVVRPYIREFRKRFFASSRPTEEPYASVFPYTQVHPQRQRNLFRLAQEIERNNIPGDVIECGVLDGGSAALMAIATATSGRRLHLFDAWGDVLPTHQKDGADAEVWADEGSGSPARVKGVMRQVGVDLNRLIFHKGLFSDTFPKAQIDDISLLHADGDYYESVKLTIETWYPKLSPGGYVQFDDYTSFVGCRRAVDEFLSAHPEVRLRDDSGIVFYLQKP